MNVNILPGREWVGEGSELPSISNVHSTSASYKLGAERNNKGGGIFRYKLLPESMKSGDRTEPQKEGVDETFTFFCFILWI